MLSALHPRRLGGLHAEDVPSQAWLAIVAGIVAIASLPAVLRGDPTDLLTFVAVLALVVAFTAGALLQQRGRGRAAALTAAISLVVAHFAFGRVYHEAPILLLASPIAFMLALPYLRGRTLAAFAAFAMAPVVLHAALAVTDGDDVVFTPAVSVIASTATTLLLFVFAWRAQRIAERQTARYQDLVTELPIGVVRVDEAGRILDANAAFARAMGQPQASWIIGQSIAAYVREPLDQAFARARTEHPDMPSAELEIRRADGSTAWVRATGRRRPTPDGSTIVDAAVEDITGERAARAAVERLAAIVDSASDGIIGLDLDGTIVSANRTAVTALGATDAALVGRSIFEVASETERDLIMSAAASVREGRVVDPVELTRKDPDGQPITISVAASPVRAPDGSVQGLALIARDITEQRRAERERADLEAQLRQAQKMDAIGRLAGGVAHDFNNLLTAILGYGRMVAEHVSDQVLDDQRQVIGAAERAAELTGRLLSFSRQASGEPRPVDVDEVVRDAIAMVERLVPERIELEADLAAGAPVLVDPVDLEQVILNLVLNAVDATPGPGRIVVQTSRVELSPAFVARHTGAQTGPHVCLEVVDTGAGMDADTLAHVFEPFFTTKPVGQGTGLGLAMVYGVVQRAGGTVWPASAPGSGTAMTIYLPVAEGHAEPAQRRFEYVPTGSERVLLVEDDEGVRSLAARILRRAGYEVSVAATPDEALAISADTPFDVLVADVVMPGISGPELLARLGTDAPAVFMSGYPGAAAQSLTDGPRRAFVPKPFEPVALAHAVRTTLDAPRAG